jgi:hypothetical protein
MQKMASSQPGYPFVSSIWVRVAMACSMLLLTALEISTHFLRFKWVGWLCFGLYCLLFLPRQEGESLRAYWKKPRVIAMGVLILAALAGFGHNLYQDFYVSYPK